MRRLIYRCEDESFEGPFMPGHDCIMAHNERMDLYPTPLTDCGLAPDMGQVCGCTSPRQFIHWFPRRIRIALRQLGYDFVVYNAEVIAEGEYQCLFNHQTATVVHVRSI